MAFQNRRKCVVLGCDTTRVKEPMRHFYRFPKISDCRFTEWLLKCGLKELVVKFPVVCDKHFLQSQKLKTTLKKDAVPMVNLPNLFDISSDRVSKKKPKGGVRKCILPNCNNDKSVPNIQIFRFPESDSGLYQKWLKICKLPKDLEKRKWKFLCSKHFQSDDIIGERKLKLRAYPRLYIDSEDLTSTHITVTDFEVLDQHSEIDSADISTIKITSLDPLSLQNEVDLVPCPNINSPPPLAPLSYKFLQTDPIISPNFDLIKKCTDIIEFSENNQSSDNSPGFIPTRKPFFDVFEINEEPNDSPTIKEYMCCIMEEATCASCCKREEILQKKYEKERKKLIYLETQVKRLRFALKKKQQRKQVFHYNNNTIEDKIDKLDHVE